MQAKVGKFITAAMTPKQIRNVKTDGGNTRNRKASSTTTENARNSRNGSTAAPPARAETPAVISRYARSESIRSRNNELSLKFTKKIVKNH
jgi:hypothetical protein